MARKTIGELEDELKHKDRRIEELRREVDEQRDLVRRMAENVEDCGNALETWRDVLDMELTEDGDWTWKPFWDAHNALVEKHNALVAQWNKYVPILNRQGQPIGRPLAASEAQVETVLNLRKLGHSLRSILEETSLGFSTVRTIIGRANGSDRTTRKHRQRVERIDHKTDRIRWERKRRTGAALPKRARRVVEDGRALIKEAKQGTR
jgi:hypothetical protein